MKEKGYSNTKIAAYIGINRVTVSKYLELDYNPSNANYNTTYSSKIKPYTEDIKRMIADGLAFRKIEAKISEKVYNGAASTIRIFATRERKLIKDAQIADKGCVEKIVWKWLQNSCINISMM